MTYLDRDLNPMIQNIFCSLIFLLIVSKTKENHFTGTAALKGKGLAFRFGFSVIRF